VDDYDLGEPDNRSAGRFSGISLQTGVTILLIAVIAAVLFLFLGPLPDGGQVSDLPTATATRSLAGNAMRTPGFAPSSGTPGTAAPPVGIGNPVLGTPAGTPGALAIAPGVGTGLPGVLAGTPAAPASQIRAGMFTEVAGTGIYGLRLRFGAGSDYLTIRILGDGETLLVLDDSEEAEGETWWRVQDEQGNVGWVAQEFLEPALMPTTWSPPVASPTFQSGELQGPQAP
jgi:hypothetical protein